jgi:hypothetical protein
VLSPKPTSKSVVEVLALNTADNVPPRFRVVATAKIRAGKTKFSLKLKASTGSRWVLQVAYLQPGQHPGYSRLNTVSIA